MQHGVTASKKSCLRCKGLGFIRFIRVYGLGYATVYTAVLTSCAIVFSLKPLQAGA